MSRAPSIEPGQAGTFLQLLDHARELVGDAAAVHYLRGWLSARASEPVSPASARRALDEAELYLRRHSQPPAARGG